MLRLSQLSEMRGGGGRGGSGGAGARRGRKTAAIGKPTSNKNGNIKNRPLETAYPIAATISIKPSAATTRTPMLAAFT